jgi:hypothetical protein
VDRSVKNGDIRPGQYFVLKIEFSRYTSANAETVARTFVSGIDQAISNFVSAYCINLGEKFTVNACRSYTETPASNLRKLISDVNSTLKRIKESGDKDHPYYDIKGVCHTRLLHTILSNIYRSIC